MFIANAFHSDGTDGGGRPQPSRLSSGDCLSFFPVPGREAARNFDGGVR